MDSTRILANLDRMHETQMRTHMALHQQGALLHDLVALQKEAVTMHREVAKAIASIKADKDSSPAVKSPPSSKLIASDAMQWVGAAILLLYVAKGGDPTVLLKALFGG